MIYMYIFKSLLFSVQITSLKSSRLLLLCQALYAQCPILKALHALVSGWCQRYTLEHLEKSHVDIWQQVYK